MRIKAFELTNIRVHRDRRFDVAPVTVVTGPNDSGKSTIRDALEACLCGTYTHMHGTGNAKIRELLTIDETTGSVALVMDGDRRISRSTDGGLALSWAQRAKATEAQLELERTMGCTLDKARLALSGARFFRLDPKEQKALLQDMLGLELSPDQVEAELTQRGADAQMPLLGVFRRVCGRDRGSLVSFTRSHRQLYDERTCAKRDLERLVGEQKTLAKQMEEQVFVPEPELKQAQDRLRRAETKQVELLQRKGRIEQAQRQVEQLRKGLEEVQKTAPPEAARLAGDFPTAEDLSVRIRSYTEKLAALKQELSQVQEWSKQEQQASRRIQGLESEIESYARSLEALTCGNCGHALPGANEKREETKHRLEAVQGKLTDTVSARKALQSSIASRQAEAELFGRIQKGTEILRGLIEQLDTREAHDRAAERHQGHAARVQAAQEALSAAESELAALGSTEEILRAGIEAEEAILEARQVLRNHADYYGMQKLVEANREKVHKTTEMVACLEILVPFYAPSGYQQEHTQGALGGFESLLNRWLSRMDLEGRFSADLVLEVARRGGAFVPYSRCADSAYLLSGLALQLAFAQYTGLGIVCLDRLESLDAQRREDLLHLCVDLVEGEEDAPDHIFLFGAVEHLAAPTGVKHIDLAQVPAEVA